MVIRDMGYQYLDYHRMMKNQEELLPIISLILYCGSGTWEDTKELKEMMEIPEQVKDEINNWKIKVVDIKELEISKFKEKKVRTILEGVQWIYDRRGRRKGRRAPIIDKEEGIIIAALTSSPELVKKFQLKEEEIDMCDILEEEYEEKRQEGIKLGKKEGMKLGKKEGIKEAIIQIEGLLKQGFSIEEALETVKLG